VRVRPSTISRVTDRATREDERGEVIYEITGHTIGREFDESVFKM
jgi:hypothetical protein